MCTQVPTGTLVRIPGLGNEFGIVLDPEKNEVWPLEGRGAFIVQSISVAKEEEIPMEMWDDLCLARWEVFMRNQTGFVPGTAVRIRRDEGRRVKSVGVFNKFIPDNGYVFVEISLLRDGRRGRHSYDILCENRVLSMDWGKITHAEFVPDANLAQSELRAINALRMCKQPSPLLIS